jgi:hypothetical protein
MQNIEVNLGDDWRKPNCYTGTKEDLIAAGLAKEFMFAEPPKRNKFGWLDCNGWPIDGHPFDYPEKYNPYGKTRAIDWSTKRVIGGKYELSIDKSWEEKQAFKNPPLTEDNYLEKVSIKAIGAAIAIKVLAERVSDRNPKGYRLSKHHEITQLIDRVIVAVNTSTVVATHDDKPFRVIDGDKI